jgi:hypothetical protein
MHPLQPSLSSLSDKDLDEKIQELTKKYFQAIRFSPSISQQILLLLEGYKQEQQERFLIKNKKGDDDLNELIKID